MNFSTLRDYEVYESLRQGSLISFLMNGHTFNHAKDMSLLCT